MTPEEIRHINPGVSMSDITLMCAAMLQEIAAQLAELNKWFGSKAGEQ